MQAVIAGCCLQRSREFGVDPIILGIHHTFRICMVRFWFMRLPGPQCQYTVFTGLDGVVGTFSD